MAGVFPARLTRDYVIGCSFNHDFGLFRESGARWAIP